MSDDQWKNYLQLRMTCSSSVPHPETGETVWFHPGDDPPEWARRRMGPHVFGFVEPPAKFEKRYHDGKLAELTITCDFLHLKPKFVTSFQILEPVHQMPDGAMLFRWHHQRWTRNASYDTKGTPMRTLPDEIAGDGRRTPGQQVPALIRVHCCRNGPDARGSADRFDWALSLIRHADRYPDGKVPLKALVAVLTS